MGKRSLQITSAISGAIPVATGIIGMTEVGDPLYASAGVPTSTLLDNLFRLPRFHMGGD